MMNDKEDEGRTKNDKLNLSIRCVRLTDLNETHEGSYLTQHGQRVRSAGVRRNNLFLEYCVTHSLFSHARDSSRSNQMNLHG
jgi:hypothetical protein